jgi:hypothetical protein
LRRCECSTLKHEKCASELIQKSFDGCRELNVKPPAPSVVKTNRKKSASESGATITYRLRELAARLYRSVPLIKVLLERLRRAIRATGVLRSTLTMLTSQGKRGFLRIHEADH